MADAQAEKPCKPEGLDARIEAFQRPAEDFRAHIDAERHLQLHTASCDLGRRWRGQHGVELSLRCTFGRFLQDAVDDIVRGCSDRLGVGGNGRPPARHQRAAAVAQQRGLPEHADGEQVGDACIGCAAQLRLPEPIPAELSPAAQRGQQAVEITVQRVLRKSQASDAVDDCVFGIGWRIRHIPCETCQAGDFRGQIVGRDDPPGAVGTTGPADRPERLALVEIARCPVTDAFVDDAGPVDRGCVAGQLGDRGDRLRGRARGCDGVSERGQARRAQRGRRVLQGRPQIVFGDFAGLEPFCVPMPRHGDGDTGRASQSRRRHFQGLAGLAEEGVDRNAGGERPQRRDGACRTLGGGDDHIVGQGHRHGGGRRGHQHGGLA